MNAIGNLLAAGIDYAGLFPPAGLDMSSAVRNYADYRTGTDAWALGRFVVPASRLGEFEREAEQHIRRLSSNRPWQLSVLAGADLESDLQAVTGLHQRRSEPYSVAADTFEAKASSKRSIEDVMRALPDTLQAYIEIPINRDPYPLLTTIAGLGGRAKVRTGGVTEDAFPSTGDLLRFIRGCVQAGIPFKATAGLHHPLRAEYRLTYAPDSPSATMFGFLNLFLTTAFIRSGMEDHNAARLLEERSPETFQVTRDEIGWRGYMLHGEALRASRKEGMISFGSCSFTEPLSELEAMHLLPDRVQPA
jgi:hypothetical protein